MYRIIKYILDRIISFISLIIISPIFILIMLFIKIDSRGPVFFTQDRIGKNKKKFKIYKFRTMYINSPKNVPTNQLENPNKWITRIGKILRKTSLDELPQLINIIKSDMSIIGPRPALWNQNHLIRERDKYNVHSIHPGLTGFAQINGRDKLSDKEKAILDGFYKENIGLFLDIKIFFKTIKKVFISDGIVEGKIKKE